MCLVLALWLEGEGNLNSEVGKAGRHFAKSPQTAKRKFLSSLVCPSSVVSSYM